MSMLAHEFKKLDCVPRPSSLLKYIITGWISSKLLSLLEIIGFKLVLKGH